MNRDQMIKELGAYCDSQKSCSGCKLDAGRQVCDFDNMSNELLKGLHSAVFRTTITDNLTGVVKEETKSITEIIEDVKNNICDHYCKYPSEINDHDEMLETVCSKCPLNRL